MKRLKKLNKLGRGQLNSLIEKKESFVLYVRSEKDFPKIREIFDVDVVFPELEKAFGNRIRFFWCDIDEVKELEEYRVFFAPSVLLFREGKIVKRLEGIKSWAEYNRAMEELLC